MFQANYNSPVALIAGVTGMVGVALTEALKKPTALGGPWKVYGVSRRLLPTWFPSSLLDKYITLDTLNIENTRKLLAPLATQITHVFWLAINVNESEELNISCNSKMLSNVLNTLTSAPNSTLRHDLGTESRVFFANYVLGNRGMREGLVSSKDCISDRAYALDTCRLITVGHKLSHLSLTESFRRIPRDGIEKTQVVNLKALLLTLTCSVSFLFFASDDSSGRRGRFAVLGFGSAVVAVVALSFVAGSVLDFWAGMVETIVSAIFSMMSCGGFPAESVMEWVMAWLPKCAALQERVGGWEWVDMMVLYCQSSATDDREFERRAGVLLREMEDAYDERMDFIRELEVVPGVIVVVKTTEFLKETLWKDDRRLRKLRNLEMDVNKRAFQKDRFIERI
ncbi:3-oxo-delta(4,5)-steroid 5-beta-reductase-like protein [Tanacetum coccineum]|uniref:3-oxo-delta(4,5)-steroid 5-beta-reductase-like protein n=1 Tax=Tanacetum coccineum TaxID=301880 RepID=A0ABQ5CQ19_9ASTR